MTNTINLPSDLSSLNIDVIDLLLPFEGKDVWIWHIAKEFKSYGHWRLSMEIEVSGVKKMLYANTTNSQLVDEWPESKQQAVEIVLEANEEHLTELIENA